MNLCWFAVCSCLALAACGSDSKANDGAGGNAGSGQGGSAGSLVLPDGGPFTNPVDAACVTGSAEARLTPLDIALAVDTSYSMDFDFKWQGVSGALLTFASAPGFKNLGVALQFFPLVAQCDLAGYGEPAVPMAELPGAEPLIRGAVEAQRMAGGTPLVQVLGGMGAYVQNWAKNHADRRSVLVLATDGIPDATCAGSSFKPPNSLANAASVAKQLAEGKPPVPVFVIGVGSELSALDSIAEAGGSKKAILVAVGNDTTRQFLDALASIRQSSLACEYAIQNPASGSIDYSAVNVRFTEAGREPETFYYVPSSEACGAGTKASWHYDNAQAPTKVVLCPETCSRVSAATDARIDTVFGCKRNDAIE